MNKKVIYGLLAIFFLLYLGRADAITPSPLDNERAEAIKNALGPEASDRIKMISGQGKVDADPSHKLSYFIFTADPNNRDSETYLIPMATSRFDKYNYQTDEWWDAHKDEIARARAAGQPVPRQDPNEVDAWLRQNGLSTNPDVFILKLGPDAASSNVSTQPLQDFLIDYYKNRSQGTGKVSMYRGAEKPNEIDSWEAHQYPRGVRYWTPDANYAWRYARKSGNFLQNLVEGKTPLFKFEIPLNDFIGLVRSKQLVLGTEMTKNAHASLNSYGRFADVLSEGNVYLGDGMIGVEMEMRATRSIRDDFEKFYAGPITIEELGAARKMQIKVGFDRLRKQYPNEVESFNDLETRRLNMVEAEVNLLLAVKNGESQDVIEARLREIPAGTRELTNVDGPNLASFARDQARKMAAGPCGILQKEMDGA